MNRLSRFSLLIFLGIALIFTACKKDSDPPSENETNSQIASQADDESRVSSELDAIAADATILLEADPATSGDNSVLEEMICDATVEANTGTNPMTLTITYNGGNCSNIRTRTGKVILSMAQGTKWKDAGAAVNVEFQDLKITRKSDQKSITINGTKTYTNVSGGLMYQLATAPITHKITSNGLSIKFDNGTAREWQVARQYLFTYSGGVVISISGLHSEGNVDGIVEWGTNRFGNAFTTSIGSALVIKQDCNFRVTGGTVTHKTPAYTATATFGLNASGAVTSCPSGTDKYYYKLEWSGTNGGSVNALIPY